MVSLTNPIVAFDTEAVDYFSWKPVAMVIILRAKKCGFRGS